jgi:NitT/TauT family transport system permease protein
MKKIILYRPISPVKKFVLGTITFVLFILLWEAITVSGVIRPIFLPSPSSVLKALVEMFTSHDLLEHIAVSVWRVIAGFSLAALISVPIGIAIGSIRSFEALISPFNDFVRYMPVVAFVPLCILWAGIGDFEKMLVIFLGTVFQLIPMVADTTGGVPRTYIETAASLGLSNWQILKRVVWRAIQPQIFDHLRVSIGWAWSYIVVAEMVAAQKGIGHIIIQSQRFLQTEKVMAGILVVGILGLLTDQLFKWAGKKLFFWHESKRD